MSPGPNTSSQKVIAGTLLNFIGQAYSIALGIVVVPYVVHRLKADLYGLLMIAVSLGGFGGLLNFGMGRTLSKYVSELYWKGDLDGIGGLFETAWTITLAGGAVAFLALVIPRNLIQASLFHGTPETEAYVHLALIFTAFGLLLSMTTETLSAIPTSLQRFDLVNYINIAVSTIRQLGSVVAIYLGFYVKGVLIAYLTGSLFMFVATLFVARRILPSLSFRPRIQREQLRRLVLFSSSVFVAGVAALVVHRLDRLIVAYYLPLAAVAFYVVPYSLAERVPMGVANITSVIYPAASELFTMGEFEKVRELYLRSSKMVALVALPVSVLLGSMSSTILHYYVGADFAAHAAWCLTMVAGGFLLNSLCHVPFVTAQAIGRPDISAKYSVLNAALNLVFFLLLIPKYGINGAAGGFLISELVVAILITLHVNRIIGTGRAELVRKSYLRPIACGAGMLIVVGVLYGYAKSPWALLALICLALAVYSCLSLLFCLDRREKSGIYEHASGWRGRFSRYC